MKRWWTLPFALFLVLCMMVNLARAQDDSSDDSDSSDSSDASAPAAASATVPGAVAVAGAPDTSVSSRPGPQDLITMNFQNVDIPVLANFISEITGKNFVVDENVRGKISIISPTKVTPDQAYSIFQSVLQLKGFTTQQAGPVIKIVPARDVRQSAALTQSQEPGVTQGDEYVTRMVRLRNTDAASVMSVIQPMVSHDGLIAAFPQDNTLIITDDAFNVQRLLRIIGALDVRGVQQDVAVIPLKLAFADDVSQQIEKIMSARDAATHGAVPRPGIGVVAPSAQGAAVSFAVVPDERTNSLIVLASPIQMRQIKALVAQLDIHAPNETYRIHVVHLNFAPAGEMVQTLDGLLGGGAGPSTLSPTTGRNSLGRGSALGNLNGSAFGSGFGSGSSSGAGGLGGMGGAFGGTSTGFGGLSSNSSIGGGSSGFGSSSLGSSRSNQNSTASAGTSGGRGTDFESPVNVTADLATNSLIVSAAPQDYETLKRVIEQLDIPRTQVFVQAILVEVSVDHTKDIGVNFIANGTLGSNVLGIGVLNTGNLQTALGNPLGLTGLGIGLASGSNCTVPSSGSSTTTTTGTTTGTIVVPCDIALMTALQSDTHANILSAPTLLTADNEEAMIVVGQNLPFVGSAAANSALSGQIFNSVDRQNVGISLDMVPQVSEGDSIRLDIYEEVSNVINGTTNQTTNPLGPTTTIRSASTTVFVQNHRTAVIGGLISNETDTARTGVPFLSDIPVIGNLLSDNSKNTTKDNLLIFLTPHIVRSRNDLTALSIDERQKFVHELGKKEVNVMPPSQFQRLYKPTFNAPVSPQEDLEQSQPLPPSEMSLPNSAMPSSSGPTASYPPISYSYPPASYPAGSNPTIAYPAAPNAGSGAGNTSGTGTYPSVSGPPPVYRGPINRSSIGNSVYGHSTGGGTP